MAFWESTWRLLNTLESMTGSYHSWVLAEGLQHSDICTSVFSVAQFTLVTMETAQVSIHGGEDGENVAHTDTHTQRETHTDTDIDTHTHRAMVSTVSFLICSKIDSNGNCYTKEIKPVWKRQALRAVSHARSSVYKHT